MLGNRCLGDRQVINNVPGNAPGVGDQKLDNFFSSDLTKKMTRKELAVFIDQEFDPFNRLPVD